MEIVFVIVGIVALVSFYDYISAKSWQQITSSLRNEVVFKNRNKDYGAYVLRRDYDKRMLGIIFGVVLSVGLMSSTLLLRKKADSTSRPKTVDFDTTLIVFDEKDEIFDQKKETVKTDAGNQTTPSFIAPVVMDEPMVVDTNSLVFSDTTEVGASSSTGSDGFGIGTSGGGNGGGDMAVVSDTLDKEPLIAVDEDARFRGDISEFIVKNLIYPETAIRRGAQGKCHLKFVVNRDGSIVDINVERGVPDCEECDWEAKRVLRKMPNWIPGKMSGRPVRTYVLLPINFKIH